LKFADHHGNGEGDFWFSLEPPADKNRRLKFSLNEGVMSVHVAKHVLGMGLLVIGAWTANIAPHAWAQEQSTRKARNKVPPAYPELARRMKIYGVVKVQVTVATNGAVKDARLLGGHPLLADAVLDAVRQWRYQAGKEETVENLEFRFSPNE
jgi:TonB family protein